MFDYVRQHGKYSKLCRKEKQQMFNTIFQQQKYGSTGSTSLFKKQSITDAEPTWKMSLHLVPRLDLQQWISKSIIGNNCWVHQLEER